MRWKYIAVRYSCRMCGLQDSAVEVRAREDEDVIFWVEQVLGEALRLDHAARSPHCEALQASDVKIPLAGTDRVGGVVNQ